MPAALAVGGRRSTGAACGGDNLKRKDILGGEPISRLEAKLPTREKDCDQLQQLAMLGICGITTLLPLSAVCLCARPPPTRAGRAAATHQASRAAFATSAGLEVKLLVCAICRHPDDTPPCDMKTAGDVTTLLTKP